MEVNAIETGVRREAIIAAIVAAEGDRSKYEVARRAVADATNDEVDEAPRIEGMTLIKRVDSERVAKLLSELVDDDFVDRLEVVLALHPNPAPDGSPAFSEEKSA
jgi:hypothetical protein